MKKQKIVFSWYQLQTKKSEVARSCCRFRIISNAIMNCPIDVSIADHTLEVIATDGAEIKPREATNVVVSGGERYLVHFNSLIKFLEKAKAKRIFYLN